MANDVKGNIQNTVEANPPAQWSRQTVADGNMLQATTLNKMVENNITVASAIDELSAAVINDYALKTGNYSANGLTSLSARGAYSAESANSATLSDRAKMVETFKKDSTSDIDEFGRKGYLQWQDNNKAKWKATGDSDYEIMVDSADSAASATKALYIVDYNSNNNLIRIGYSGDSIKSAYPGADVTTQTATPLLAGYIKISNNEVRLKDINVSNITVGSAKDSDKLNNQPASYYAKADHNHNNVYIKLDGSNVTSGTTQTTHSSVFNKLANTTQTGVSTPMMSDFYLSQYASGSTNNKYDVVRRPHSALYQLFKEQASANLTAYSALSAKSASNALSADFTTAARFQQTIASDESKWYDNKWQTYWQWVAEGSNWAKLKFTNGNNELNAPYSGVIDSATSAGAANIAFAVCDYGDTTKNIKIGYAGTNVIKVEPGNGNTSSNTQFLIAGFSENNNAYYHPVSVGDVTVACAKRIINTEDQAKWADSMKNYAAVDKTNANFNTVWHTVTKNYHVGLQSNGINDDRIYWTSINKTGGKWVDGGTAKDNQMYWDASNGYLYADYFDSTAKAADNASLLNGKDDTYFSPSTHTHIISANTTAYYIGNDNSICISAGDDINIETETANKQTIIKINNKMELSQGDGITISADGSTYTITNASPNTDSKVEQKSVTNTDAWHDILFTDKTTTLGTTTTNETNIVNHHGTFQYNPMSGVYITKNLSVGNNINALGYVWAPKISAGTISATNISGQYGKCVQSTTINKIVVGSIGSESNTLYIY